MIRDSLVRRINSFDDYVGENILPVIIGMQTVVLTFSLFLYANNKEFNDEKKVQNDSVNLDQVRVESEYQRGINRTTTETEKEQTYGYDSDSRHEVLCDRQGSCGGQGPESGEGGTSSGCGL